MKDEVYQKPECIFNYCPHPEICKDNNNCSNHRNIEWQFVSWIERDNNFASVKGFDEQGNEYQADGIIGLNSEVIEVSDIELMEV